MRVLVIENDPDVGAALGYALTDAGHTVAVVASANEGTAHARAGCWDLCLSEVLGSEHVGVPDAEHTRIRELAGRCPVILTTGPVSVSPMLAAELGATAVLAKPFGLDALLAAVAVVAETRG